MTKKQEPYWFKHAGNARRDQKIITMRTVYGAEGYGWYWMLVEMMREAEEYKLRLTGKYDMQGLAKELDTDPDRLKEFIADCVKEFGLFESDGQTFWSPRLMDKMKSYDDLVEKKREAANARWNRD